MLSDGQIVALIEDAERNSYGLHDGELAKERSEALDYFYGRGFGNEVEGRSQVVSHDVKDTILWALTATVKPFVAGDKVVEFTPVSAEDVEAAEQETAYINHLFTDKNDGFNIIYNWQFDGFLSKVGYAKAYWDEYTETVKETYQGLSDEEFALILQDKEIAPVAHSEYVDEYGVSYHDLIVETKADKGRVCIENVAPENIMVGYDVTGTSIAEAAFVEERKMLTISELREMGFNVDDNIQGDENDRYGEESFSRDQFGEFADDFEQGANRRVLVREVYIKLDIDEKGISKLHRFVVVGNTILDRCECERIPYVAFCPNPMPHRHVGLSEADLVKDLQLIKSTLLRNALDAQYQSIHGRFAISDRVNLDDMLVSRPGGIVRVEGEPAGAIMPLVNPVDGTKNMGMIEYIDQIRQTRTGVTDSFQGMDVNALNKTKGGTQMLMNAAQSRLEVVTRHFANSLKELFILIHELVRKHSNKQEIFRLRNKWVPVDPRSWTIRKDMTVSVGLGTGNKDQMLQHLMLILQAQQQAVQIGIATPKNIYNALAKLTQNAGFQDVEEFWTDPEGQQQTPKTPSEAEIKAQVDMQKAQMEMQVKMKELEAKMQLEREKIMSEIDMAKEKLAAEIYGMNTKLAAEISIKRESMEAEAQIKREGMAVDVFTKRETAQQKVDSRQGIE